MRNNTRLTVPIFLYFYQKSHLDGKNAKNLKLLDLLILHEIACFFPHSRRFFMNNKIFVTS